MAFPTSNDPSNSLPTDRLQVRVGKAECPSSHSWRNKAGRVLWSMVYLLCFRPSPRVCYGWRRMLLCGFGARIGRNARIHPTARIWAPWNLEMGDESAVASGANIYNQAKIRLGTRVVISQGAHLCTGTHDYESEGFELFAKPITVGDHAWIAAESFVHPGVTVGEGAVIGARSVVTRDVPAWMVCSGNPCKPIKPRTMKGRSQPR